VQLLSWLDLRVWLDGSENGDEYEHGYVCSLENGAVLWEKALAEDSVGIYRSR
jgi:hypothetical protein